MSDEIKSDEIRNDWLRNLVTALNESNETAQTDAESELMWIIALAIKDNVEQLEEGDSDETD